MATKKTTKKKTTAKKTTAKKTTSKKKKGELDLFDTILYKEDDDSPAVVLNMAKFRKITKSLLDLTPKETDMMVHLSRKGEELELPDETPTDRAKFLAAALVNVTALLEASEDHKAELEAAEEAAKEADRRHSGAIVLATARGGANALALRDDFVGATQQVLGDKFVVSATGLTVKEGETVTDVEIANVVGTLASASEAIDGMRGSNLWQLGDSVILLESLDNGENVVNQVAKLTGKSKHTIREARRLCQNFDTAKRQPTLTATHHQEILNYRGDIKTAKLNSIIKKCVAGDKPTVIDTVDPDTGEAKQITQSDPWSCSQLRKALQEAAGKKPAEKPVTDPTGSDEGATEGVQGETEGGVTPAEPATAEKAPEGYVYIDGEGGVFQSETFNEEAAAVAVLTIDLEAMTTVDVDGNEVKAIEVVSEENFPAGGDAEVEAEDDGEIPE